MQKIIFILFFLLFFSGCFPTNVGVTEVPQVIVQSASGPEIFQVEVMRTEVERGKGLMYREGLEDGSAMLFIFDRPQQLNFWMKNMKFSIDMIFISDDKKILNIAKNVPPCKADPCAVYRSAGKARYVLEVDGGVADKLAIKEGTQLEFENF